jgi:hypothetical protein
MLRNATLTVAKQHAKCESSYKNDVVLLVFALHNTDFGSLVMAWFMQKVGNAGTD